MTNAAIVALLGVQLLGLLLVPLGLPGLWLQIAAAVGLVGLGAIGWEWAVGFGALAIFGETIEFLSGRWGARRFGGSPRAAWGAFLGGIVGAVVGGVPVPIIGAVVASFIGTFAGALLGEMSAQRHLAPNLRVGLGAVLGRVIGVGVKLWCGVMICVGSVTAVLW
jgi:uncharacterized protein YqgC (DUF456 family)